MAAETTAASTASVDARHSAHGDPRRRGRAATRRRSRVLTYLGLVVASCVAVFPLLFMVFSSFKDDQQIFADLGSLKAFLPTGHLSLNNYSGVFARVPAARFITNSLVVTVAIVVLGLIVNSMIGFAISRMRWKGKNIVLSLVLATLMVPFETIAVPLVYWVAKLPSVQWVVDGFLVKQGMLNTYQVQILPFIANALSIFLFAQHFGDIPKEIDEAARVDGASWWTIYSRIVVPLSGPTFATVAIITMLPPGTPTCGRSWSSRRSRCGPRASVCSTSSNSTRSGVRSWPTARSSLCPSSSSSCCSSAPSWRPWRAQR